MDYAVVSIGRLSQTKIIPQIRRGSIARQIVKRIVFDVRSRAAAFILPNAALATSGALIPRSRSIAACHQYHTSQASIKGAVETMERDHLAARLQERSDGYFACRDWRGRVWKLQEVVEEVVVVEADSLIAARQLQ